VLRDGSTRIESTEAECKHEILMITIRGAGGEIGYELVKLLVATQPFRLFGRSPKATLGATEILAADLTDRD
jgi:hypothetical protein